jgi:methyl-accepting chemotaxis protein
MKWYYDLSIANKLLVAFGVVCVIAAGVGYLGFNGINDIAARDKEMFEKMTTPMVDMAHISTNFQRVRVNTRDILLASTKSDIERCAGLIQKYRDEISAAAERYEKTLISEEAKKDFEAFKATRVDYVGHLEELMAFARSGKQKEGFALLNGDMREAADKEMAAIDRLMLVKEKGAEERSKENVSEASSAAMKLLVVMLAGIACSIVLGVVISRMIANPLRQIVQNIDNADLNSRFNTERKDEVGQLQQSFDRFVESLRQTLLKVAETAQAVASASSQISSSTEEMSSGAQEQSSQSNEVASAVEEMAKTIVENSKNAADTADTAKAAKQAAVDGGSVVGETIEGMKKIADVVSKSAATVEELGKSSDQIGEIISVIDDIADQTNLLALNAAIEAARAGEQGRGFAVVADEVRKLAERTTKATKEIASMIKKIQIETKGAVVSMGEGTKNVEDGLKLADRAGASLKEIERISVKVTEMVLQIAAASDQQSSASEQISKNVAASNQVTAETAAGTQQIAHAAEDLNRLTENLQELLAQFKLTGESAGGTHHGHHGKKSGVPKSNLAVRENGVLVAHHA